MLTLGRAKYSNLVTSRFAGETCFETLGVHWPPWPWGLEDATSCEWVQLRNSKDAPLPQLLRAISESCVWAANWDSWQHVAMWELDGGSFDPRLHYRQAELFRGGFRIFWICSAKLRSTLTTWADSGTSISIQAKLFSWHWWEIGSFCSFLANGMSVLALAPAWFNDPTNFEIFWGMEVCVSQKLGCNGMVSSLSRSQYGPVSSQELIDAFAPNYLRWWWLCIWQAHE